MFQNQDNLTDEELKKEAGEIGMDVSAFTACLDSKRYRGEIKEDVHAGTAAGVDGTPALFINGRLLIGNAPYEAVAAVIEEELKKK